MFNKNIFFIVIVYFFIVFTTLILIFSDMHSELKKITFFLNNF